MKINKNIKVGDIVEITVSAIRGPKVKVRRKVTHLDGVRGVGVTFDGYRPFWVGWAKGDKVKKVKEAKQGGDCKRCGFPNGATTKHAWCGRTA